jgi:hypothetical protein
MNKPLTAEEALSSIGQINSTPFKTTALNNTSLKTTPLNSVVLNSTPFKTNPLNTNPLDSTPLKPETIVITTDQKRGIIEKLQPQKTKNWRFAFKNDKHKTELENILKGSNMNYRVEFNTKMDKPDITIYKDDNIIGRINLMLSDRRDIGDNTKYYCKIYFDSFTDAEVYSNIKNKVINFFNRLNTVTSNKNYNKTNKANKTMNKRNTKKNIPK